jgi:hypothetical protein
MKSTDLSASVGRRIMVSSMMLVRPEFNSRAI